MHHYFGINQQPLNLPAKCWWYMRNFSNAYTFYSCFGGQDKARKADFQTQAIGVPDRYGKNQARLDVTDWSLKCVRMSTSAYCSLPCDNGQGFTCPGKLASSISQPTRSKYRAKSLVSPSYPYSLITFSKPSSSDLGAQGSWTLEHCSSEE